MTSERQASSSSAKSPTTAPLDAQQASDIDSTLASKRRTSRRGSIFDTFSRKSAPPKPAVKDEALEEEDEDVILREQEELIRNAPLDIEKYKQDLPGQVRLQRSSPSGQSEEIEGIAEDVMEGILDGREGYVWDILFENQRGIHFHGHPHFSSQTLLPIDPSPFTVPSLQIPSASTIVISEPTQPNGTSFSTTPEQRTTKAHTQQGYRRTIKTAYTPETYQTPSPAWTWLTPWMVNMRVGTDEDGWRYNSYFKKKGWSSHAGFLGWGGWVRRREWVRLRCIRPPEVVTEVDVPSQEEEAGSGMSLGQVLSSGEGGRDGLIRALKEVPLDRQKLETWKRWLDESAKGDRDKLRCLLKDDDTVHALSRTFKFQSNSQIFLDLLSELGFEVSATASKPAFEASREQYST